MDSDYKELNWSQIYFIDYKPVDHVVRTITVVEIWSGL